MCNKHIIQTYTYFTKVPQMQELPSVSFLQNTYATYNPRNSTWPEGLRKFNNCYHHSNNNNNIYDMSTEPPQNNRLIAFIIFSVFSLVIL